MITDVVGVRVGHWTDLEARTGCTVVLLPEGVVASGEVRGGAPASRETALLAPEMLVQHVDAVVLTGGSAFGLASADGVVAWLEEQGRGFVTGAGPVPIVVALGLFDLMVGDATVRAGVAEGRAACDAATGGVVELGAVGAGTGATVGKARGAEHARPGGLGTATAFDGDLLVSALVPANAFGDVDSTGGSVAPPDTTQAFGANTTIGVVATNAALTKVDCNVVAQGGHDGLARAIVPAHTRVDGDAIVAAATGEVDAHVDQVRALAVTAVEQAVRSALEEP